MSTTSDIETYVNLLLRKNDFDLKRKKRGETPVLCIRRDEKVRDREYHVCEIIVCP